MAKDFDLAALLARFLKDPAAPDAGEIEKSLIAELDRLAESFVRPEFLDEVIHQLGEDRMLGERLRKLQLQIRLVNALGEAERSRTPASRQLAAERNRRQVQAVRKLIAQLPEPEKLHHRLTASGVEPLPRVKPDRASLMALRELEEDPEVGSSIAGWSQLARFGVTPLRISRARRALRVLPLYLGSAEGAEAADERKVQAVRDATGWPEKVAKILLRSGLLEQPTGQNALREFDAPYQPEPPWTKLTLELLRRPKDHGALARLPSLSELIEAAPPWLRDLSTTIPTEPDEADRQFAATLLGLRNQEEQAQILSKIPPSAQSSSESLIDALLNSNDPALAALAFYTAAGDRVATRLPQLLDTMRQFPTSSPLHCLCKDIMVVCSAKLLQRSGTKGSLRLRHALLDENVDSIRAGLLALAAFVGVTDDPPTLAPVALRSLTTSHPLIATILVQTLLKLIPSECPSWHDSADGWRAEFSPERSELYVEEVSKCSDTVEFRLVASHTALGEDSDGTDVTKSEIYAASPSCVERLSEACVILMSELSLPEYYESSTADFLATCIEEAA